ncbi:MAG: hypothetical protein HRU19_03130 [Pseudobacteriovorax sp.]|nr:hypothetical protein [Pseudobacteriovorax sp.]
MAEKKFFCLLRNEGGGCEPSPSPTEMEAMYAKYKTWQETFANNIVDMGAKLGGEGAVVSNTEVKDGPYVELKEMVGGYMTITADTLEEAIKVVQESPMVMNPGVSIEIREVATP